VAQVSEDVALFGPLRAAGNLWRRRPTWQQIRYLVRYYPAAVAGGLLIVGVGLLSGIGPEVLPMNPNKIDIYAQYQGPGAEGHLLGTDIQGRDILARLIWGSRSALAVAILPVSIASVIGLLLASIAGFFGRPAELTILRGTDILFGLPPFMLAVAVAASLGPGVGNMVIAITAILIAPMTRVAHQVVVSIREQTFVEAARASGARNHQIVWHHVLPNMLPPVLAYGVSLIGLQIVFGAGLSFIGLGVQPPDADWGKMIAEGRDSLQFAPWVAALPGLCIFVVAIAFNVVADSVRDVLDPYTRV
jgi:peptide/nickel transport system permease protein